MGGDSNTADSSSPPGLLRSWTSSALAAQRRRSSTDRINEILENARERAEGMSPATTPQDGSGSPVFIHNRPHSMPPLHETAVGDGRGVDETTGILAHGTGQDYQSIQSTGRSRTRTGRGASTTRFLVGPPSQGPLSQPPFGGGIGLGVQDMPMAVEAEAPPTEKSMWDQVFGSFRSIELENKGSVARDHLALERTFLAWLRTSLAFASIGVAVTQLFRLNTSLSEQDGHKDNLNTLRQMGRPLGATFIGISIATLLMGYKRYFNSQEWVMKGKFPVSRGTITVTAFLAFAVIVLSLVVVLVIHPQEER